MFDKEFLEKIACPKCKGDLKYVEESKSFVCKNCNTTYEIRKGIPIFIFDEENDERSESGKF